MKNLSITFVLIFFLVGFFAMPASAQGGLMEISAKAIEDHSCVADEWHFVITQVDSESQAPPTIHVTWENASEADIPLDKYTGKTAHYATTLHLDSPVASATAMIYEGWVGEFNLSHGPCDPGTPQASYSIETACWEPGKDTASFVVNHVTLDISGPGGPYVINSNTTMELEPGDYFYTATPDPGYQLIGAPEGEFSIEACPVNGNHEEGSNGGALAINVLMVIIAASFIALVFKQRSKRNTNPY